MKKFVIENTLYLHESVKENRLTSYDDVNLINSSNNNNNNNNYKLTCIDKNIKRLDRLEGGLILPLNIQKFAQRKELLNKRDTVISELNLTQYEDITYDAIKNEKVKIIEPEFVCNFNTLDEKGNKITYTKNNAKFRKANLTKDERKVINRLREELGWNMNLLREIEKPTSINVPDIERIGKTSNDYYEIKSVYKSESSNSQRKKYKDVLMKLENNLIKLL